MENAFWNNPISNKRKSNQKNVIKTDRIRLKPSLTTTHPKILKGSFVSFSRGRTIRIDLEFTTTRILSHRYALTPTQNPSSSRKNCTLRICSSHLCESGFSKFPVIKLFFLSALLPKLFSADFIGQNS